VIADAEFFFGIQLFDGVEGGLCAFDVADAAALRPIAGELAEFTQATGGETLGIVAGDFIGLLPQAFGIGEAAAVEGFPTIGEGAAQAPVEGVTLDILGVGDDGAHLIEPTGKGGTDGADGVDGFSEGFD